MKQFYIASNKYSLQERKTKNGTVYDVMFRIITLSGDEKLKKLSGYTSKSLAKRGYLEFISEFCEPISQKPKKGKKEGKKSKILFEDGIREYLSFLLSTNNIHNKDSTIYDKQNIYNLHIVPYFQGVPLDGVTKEKIENWQNDFSQLINPKNGKPYSVTYLFKVRGHLGSFLQWAEKNYGIANNMPKVDRPKRKSAKRKLNYWDKETFDKFIDCVDNPMYHCLFTMLFFTGRRKGEVLCLTKQDISNGYITWEKSISKKIVKSQSGQKEPYKITSTKEDKVQTLPMTERLKQELKNYNGEEPFFFGGEKPIPETTLTRVFQHYCKIAEVPIIRIHDLRHSFASMLLFNGENFMVIAELIGDTVEQVIKTYCHINQKDLLNAINKL